MNTKPRITLATLPQATKQEVFDQVKAHLLAQKAKSKNSLGTCNYRGEGGRMCAAGCLIADNEYTPYMDNESDGSWGGLVNEGVFPKEHRELIQQLQDIHDGEPEDYWVEELKQLARSVKLTY